MMTVRVKDIRRATAGEWDDIWKNCGYATYFHSREWTEIWKDYSQGELFPEPMLVTFSDRLKALLTLSCKRIFKGLAKKYISSPAGTFGGWISRDDLSSTHACLLANTLTGLGNISWRINPYDELTSEINITDMKGDETRVIDLKQGFDGLLKNWTKGHYSAVTQARKAGVVVRLAETLQDWHLYYDAYVDSLRRWGASATSRYSIDLFNHIFGRRSPYVKLWLAMYQDKIISGALCFYSSKHVVYWHGATLEQYFYLRPVNLLMYEAILDACREGYQWFDFNPSGGHKGVEEFKKSFGTKQKPCPIIARSDNRVRLLKQVQQLLTRR